MTEVKQNEDLRFVGRMFYRILIPSLISSFGLSLGNVVDAVVLGKKIGENGLAAISFVLPIYMIFNVFDVGLSVGGALIYSKLLGEGKSKEAAAHFNDILLISLVFSMLFVFCGIFFTPQILICLGTTDLCGEVYTLTYDYASILLRAAPLFFANHVLFEFVRCDSGEKRAAIGMLGGNVVDILLNLLFVLKMGFGVEGAVWATVIGQGVSVCIHIGHLFQKRTILRFRFAVPHFGQVLKSFRIGFAASSRYILQFLYLIAANRILMEHHGATGVAVFDLIMNVSYIAMTFFEGTSQAMQPLVSTFCGERNETFAGNVKKRAFHWAMVLTLILLLVGGIFAKQLCSVFGFTSMTGSAIGVYAVRIYGIGVLLAGWNLLQGSYLQANGNEMWCYLMSFLRNFAILLPCTLVFCANANLKNCWWMYPVTELLSCTLWVVIRKIFVHDQSETTDDGRILRIGMCGDQAELSRMQKQTEFFCKQWNASQTQVDYVLLTIQEVCNTVLLNTSSQKSQKDRYIQLTLIALENSDFEIHLRDNYASFHPFDKDAFQIQSNIKNENFGEILLVKQKAKSFFYRRYLGFHTLIVTV